MILFKEVLKRFNIDWEFPKTIVEAELPIDKMFDKCEYERKKGLSCHYYAYVCSYSDDSIITLEIPCPKGKSKDEEISIYLWGIEGYEDEAKCFIGDGRVRYAYDGFADILVN